MKPKLLKTKRLKDAEIRRDSGGDYFLEITTKGGALYNAIPAEKREWFYLSKTLFAVAKDINDAMSLKRDFEVWTENNKTIEVI
jgi:hypothetical protein